MSDTSEKLISLLLEDPKINREGVYRDEPILKTASQLTDSIYPKIKHMNEIARQYQSDAKVFFYQGKFMEDYTDNFEYKGDFRRYFPTYRSMTTEQMRGYFSWRTKIRRGEYTPAPLSFVFVYIYELLNLIGVKTAEEGYEALVKFRDNYSEIDGSFNNYLSIWLFDFVVYWGLDSSLLKDHPKVRLCNAVSCLMNSGSASEEALFEAIAEAGTYNVAKSVFYKKYPEDFRTAVCRVYKSISEFYVAHRRKPLAEKLFGSLISPPYHMFTSAVFYDPYTYQNYRYEINPCLVLTCKNGYWRCTAPSEINTKSRELGNYMKALDSIMRHRYGFKRSVCCPLHTKIYLEIIAREIDELIKEKSKPTPLKIEIDISKLEGIRLAADNIRDKLIIEEEREAEPLPEQLEHNNAPDNTAAENNMSDENNPHTENDPQFENNTPLSPEEYEFMCMMLYGGDYGAFLRKKGIMLSVIADKVNEKLFDNFGDTVIEFEGETPLLIEDYREELKGMIKL